MGIAPLLATPAPALPSAEPKPPPSVDTDPVMRVLALRADTHAGPCWALDADLASALGAPLAELARGRPEDAAPTEWEWATTLVIALLQLRYHDRASLWAPIVDVRRRAMTPQLMRYGMEAVCALQLSLG